MADIAAVAALIAEPRRAAMLDLLMDGSARPAGELAREAGVAPSTASGHLALLLRGGLVACDIRGRERRYRLSSPSVAEALEALSRVAPPVQVRSLRGAQRIDAIRNARTCYDHVAGRLGVGLAEALVESGALELHDSSYEVTPAGEDLLAGLGVDVSAARRQRRSFAQTCLDWSEGRPHIAGALGAELADALLGSGWVRRRTTDRGLLVTETGKDGLHRLGVAVERF